MSYNFTSDTRGVAPVIGFILLFGILILGLTTYQAQIVPQENAATEFQHYEQVRNEMIELRNSISTAGQADVSQYQDIKLGTQYQSRTFTINPPPPSGILQTSKEYNITITDESGTTVNISTKFIEYQPGYFEIDVGELWYEHSVIYIDERDEAGIAVIEDQSLITEDGTVRLTALQGNISVSKTGRETIELYPASSDAEISDLSGNLTIDIPTRLNGTDYWNDTLDEHDKLYDQVVDSGYEPGVHKLQLENVTSNDGFELNTVGISTEPTEDSSRYNIGVGGSGGTDEDGGGPPSGSESELGSNNVAFDDRNRNNLYDDSEPTYTADEVGDKDLSGVNLVVEKDIRTDGIVQTVMSLTIRDGIRVETTSGLIDFNTNDKDAGSLDVSGSTLASASGSPLLLQINKGQGDVNLQGATVESGQVLRVTLDSDNAGLIDAADATVKSGSNQAVTLDIKKGTGDINLQNANVVSEQTVRVKINDAEAGGINALGATITSGSFQPITLSITKGSGGINVKNANIDSDQKLSMTVNHPTGGSINAESATLKSTSDQPIELMIKQGTGGISVQNADIDSDQILSMTVDDTSAGSIDAKGATLRSANNQPVRLEIKKGSGNIDLKDARIVLPTSRNADAIGNNNGNQLFVNTDTGNGGTVVIDRSDTDAQLDARKIDVEDDAELERGVLT